MLEIVICEDNQVYRQMLHDYIESISQSDALAVHLIKTTQLAEEVLDCIGQTPANVFLLGIQLKGKLNGYDLAAQIRQALPRAYIIFISEHLEYILQAFKVRAFDFLPKPVTREALFNCLHRVASDMIVLDNPPVPAARILEVRSGSTVYLLQREAIFFIEKIGNRAIIHMPDKEVTCLQSLDSFEAQLSVDPAFVRCHKSFLINTRYIAEIQLSTGDIYLTSGHKCYLSRKYKDRLIGIVKYRWRQA